MAIYLQKTRVLLCILFMLTTPYWLAAQSTQEVCPGDPPTWCYVEGFEGSDFQWWADGALILDDQNNRVLLRWPKPGKYQIKVVETSPEGCESDTVKMQIVVTANKETGCIPVLDAPNIFTPNGDGENDLFTIKGKYVVIYELIIFNRWGEIIFESDDLSGQWDGTIHGNPVPEGTYFWGVRYGNEYGTDSAKGFVTLHR